MPRSGSNGNVSRLTARVAALTAPDGGRAGRDRTRVRLAKSIGATLLEGLSLYWWLRWAEDGNWWWALAALVAGEVLETAFLQIGIRRAASKRWDKGDADTPHFQKVRRIVSAAGNLEVGIWLLWFALVQWLDDSSDLSRPYQIAAAGAVLLVLMHLKHHVESAALRDLPFRKDLFSLDGMIASAMEVGGAVACLALIEDGQYVLAGAALAGGLLIEHFALIGMLGREIMARDLRLPRDPRWKPPLQRDALIFVVTHFRAFWKLAERIGPFARWFNRYAINARISVVDPRPNLLSTMAAYPCWPSLTDRSYSGRHLPPASSQGSANTLANPPAEAEVAELFRRDGEMIECPKSTVLFGWFAQWFTDGFLRSSRQPGLDGVRNTLRNESNHEVDLSPLYGCNAEVTAQLRARSGGLLTSQCIGGEEYPAFLCASGRRKGQFSSLPTPIGVEKLLVQQKDGLFAMGTDITNLGFVAFNVLFLREHNRIARRLVAENPSWDDERVFQTARNVLTVVLLNIVVEEYIDHISGAHFRPRLEPGSFPNEPWYRPNWMTVEFNLLYRWHTLAPSSFFLNGAALSIEDTLFDTELLTAAGLGPLMAAASSQPAGRIGLCNTHEWFIKRVEVPSIRQARNADLCSYNDYRRLCRYAPVTDWREISSDQEIQKRLKAVYGEVDKVELYVGLFAEDTERNGVLPPLMNTMVAFDAFSQALTNPLLAPRVFTPETFSDAGWEIIRKTRRLSDIVNRKVPCGSEYFISFTRRDFKRV